MTLSTKDESHLGRFWDSLSRSLGSLRPISGVVVMVKFADESGLELLVPRRYVGGGYVFHQKTSTLVVALLEVWLSELLIKDGIAIWAGMMPPWW